MISIYPSDLAPCLLGFVCLRWPSGPTPVHGLAHRLIASAGPATEGGKDTASKCHKGKEFPAWQSKVLMTNQNCKLVNARSSDGEQD